MGVVISEARLAFRRTVVPAVAGIGCGALLALGLQVACPTSAVAESSGQSLLDLFSGNVGESGAANEAVVAWGSSIQASTSGYYADVDGSWIDDPQTLEEGLAAFEERTGVRPYLLILPNAGIADADGLAAAAEGLYDTVFSDENGFLLLFCDEGDGTYSCGFCLGADAGALIGSEVLAVFNDELAACYQDLTLTEEELFAKAYSGTAATMPESASGTSVQTSGRSLG